MNPNILPLDTATTTAQDKHSIIGIARTLADSGDELIALHLRAIDIAVQIAAEELENSLAAGNLNLRKCAARHLTRHIAAENLALFHIHLLDLHLDKLISATASQSES